MQWVIDHQGLVAGAVVALLDLAFAANPNWASNGLLHWVYVALKGKSG